MKSVKREEGIKTGPIPSLITHAFAIYESYLCPMASTDVSLNWGGWGGGHDGRGEVKNESIAVNFLNLLDALNATFNGILHLKYQIFLISSNIFAASALAC